MQAAYTRLMEAAGGLRWHASAMKPVFIAVGLFLAGAVLIDAIPEADLLPSGVRAVLEDVASIW